MYRPAHFEENRPEVLHALISAHPLGQLVTHGPEGLDANPLPFELDAAAGLLGTLRAHVARANPVWQQAGDTEVLVIFQAADGYISPNWYPSKHAEHRQVPTWNYEVVHAHGTITVHDDERFVRRVVARLTRRHEAAEAKPWKMGDAAPEYIDSLLRNIVGIEVAITSLVGKIKLSQNKEALDRLNAADVLAERGHGEMAQAMRRAG